MARPSLLPRPMLPRSRSANSACSLPSSAVMLTALAASLSSCSDDTLASISETVFATSRLFNSAACDRLLCRSCNALSMHATDASRPPRRTRRGLRAPPLFGWFPHRSSPRKHLDFVARLPFLPVAQAKLLQRVHFPHYAFFKDVALHPNIMNQAGFLLLVATQPNLDGG